MEPHASSFVGRQGSIRKAAMPTKDLLSAVRNGSAGDVDAALALLKKNNGNIDARNSFGSTALHLAVWRNHVPIVRRLLAGGANPDIRDGESGWSSLHRALHFGHLAVAGLLIEAGANLFLEDSKGRTPVDLVSGPVKQVMDDPNNAGGTEVFSWGNGANYQLGTGTAGIQKLPCRLDLLQGLNVTSIAAAKFHSMAASADGKLYSWGFGRGGRLGFPDFDIHSGQVAVITPRQVCCGIGNRRVKILAVAKHHSLVATEGGEVFTWGSNREGQLGYTSVDTQPTPRRVTTLKARVVAAAVANKHSAVLTEAGEVFTWGCNREGQLGYGTSNSASNPVPRAVEYLKGKAFLAVSVAKYHTAVLSLEGEVFTWGYKLVTPRRVSITRNTKKAGNVPLKFHQAERLHIVAIAAGTTHSTAVSEDGLLFYWVSADPSVRCHQLMGLAGHQALAVAAGKYRTAVVTASGNIYAWDGEKMREDMTPVPFRIHGVKHAIHVSVGENHSLAVAAVYMPKLPSHSSTEVSCPADNEQEDALEEDLEFDEMGIAFSTESKTCSELLRLPHEPPSLKELCENVISQQVVEAKNALQLLEVADSLGAGNLRKHCEDLVLHNLDYLLTVSPMTFAHVTPTLLAEVEKALDATSSQSWSHRLLPTPTALFPAVVDSEEDDCESGFSSRMRSLSFTECSVSGMETKTGSENLFHQESGVDQAVAKQFRALKKKLQQIEALELKLSKGHVLDHQQLAKLEAKQSVEEALLAIDFGTILQAPGVETEMRPCIGATAEGFEEKEGGSRRSRNGRRKSNKLVREQSPIDELQKKAKNGHSSKAGNKKFQNTSLEVTKKAVDNSSAMEKQAEQYKGSNRNCESDVQGFDSPLSRKMLDSNNTSTFDSISNALVKPNPDQVKIHGFVAEVSEKSLQSFPSLKKKQKKGGLSMFLSGALDNVVKVPEVVQAPPVPKTDGPAWGGAKRNSGLSSLREIQSQQTAEASSVLVDDTYVSSRSLKMKQVGGDLSAKGSLKGYGESVEPGLESVDTGTSRISLSEFMRTPTTPIPVTPVKAGKVTSLVNPDSSPTPWAGTSPLTSASSFKEIQLEQVKGKKQQKHGATLASSTRTSNPSSSTNISARSGSLDKGIEENVPNRWFKPEMRSPSSIRCIQIEEEAMKELRRMYKNVKVARSGDIR